MSQCKVTSSKGSKGSATVIIVGHSKAKMPKDVEQESVRLAKGTVSGVQHLVCGGQHYFLANPDDKEYLAAGESWRIMGGQIVKALRAASLTSAAIILSGQAADAQSVVEGVLLGDYQFISCRSGKVGKRKTVTVQMPGHAKAVKAGTQVAECQNLARELCDLPGNLMNPVTFVKRAQKELKNLGLRIKVIQGEAALRKAGFPGLAQVGMAGSAAPAMLQVSYVPKKITNKKKHYAMVGKGVTFDSGGISLKPGAGMWEMKGDMGGAAGVLGAIKLIALQNPSIRVSAYMALAENMPDSQAQRPGDIYQARNGKYIHVDNTDAEGRLVLSDVLTYACEQGATHMVDAATLTGACLVALGSQIAAVMSPQSDWAQTVRQAGQDVGEELWELPLYAGYRSLLDHPHADINNMGGRFAGSITAGLFLSEFVDKKVKWAHCDIAGPAMMGDSWGYYTKGNTGFVVRTFARLATCLK